MFAGIVETKSPVVKVSERPGVLEIHIQRPQDFQDLTLGDSIACDGVCLTLEKYDQGAMQFALGPETLRITGWQPASVLNRVVNLERSLRLNDRIHGHLVTGHVDGLGRVVSVQSRGETVQLKIGFPVELKPYIWPKGSIAVNGVSLTVNTVGPDTFEVGLIPETLKRTNLSTLESGSPVNLEIDNMARGLVHVANLEKERRT
jgi:riboflavin synthase